MIKNFQYEWWNVEVQEATGKTTWEVKAKNEEGAKKQFNKMAKQHNDFIQKVRPDFNTTILWNTLKLDRKGYQRIF